MTKKSLGRPRLALAFARAACVYWLNVFPLLSRQVKSRQRHARVIPDEALRSIALEVQHTKRGNLEGAAAFATFVPRAHRRAVIGAQVALQGIYDYVDALAEQPSDDPILNSSRLHQALQAALTPNAPHSNYYSHHAHTNDGEYLRGMADACRASLGSLPSHTVIAAPTLRFAQRIIAYQTFNVSSDSGQIALARWASSETPGLLDLRWWETAASTGSSLGIFALLALAADPHANAMQAGLIEHAYFPWIGALHSLLDSLIDIEEDAANGQPNLVAHYASTEEVAIRMRLLAVESDPPSRAPARRRKSRADPDGYGELLSVSARGRITSSSASEQLSSRGPRKHHRARSTRTARTAADRRLPQKPPFGM